MHRLGVVLSALTVSLSGGIACAAASDGPDAARPTVERRLDTVGPIDTVVAISIDGLNPNAITKLGRRGAPTLHKLIRQGATTLNARTELELTDTLPNHTGMVTGRRIEAATGGHGVTRNDDRRTPATVQAAAGHDVSSVFNVVHDAGGDTAYFASKTKFSLWERSWPEAIDADVIVENNKALVANFPGDLTNETRSFRFLHLSAPDVAGHATGFMGPGYLRAVTATDRLVGRVLRAVKASPTLAGHTAIILTSDHGGRGASHRAPNRPANYTVPFMVWGPDVARGANLYAINPTYSAPGRTQTTYADSPIRNGDVANLALDLLELPAVPRQRAQPGPGPDRVHRSAGVGHGLNRQPSRAFDCCIITGAG
ncbi:alkaline phosphatase family protein [Nocardioides sp. B-3]|uniref:alkaline phosphatase family protein n=1 Tax=Nocardioides sp. B-3 TaxID=2895565 RepID=UPI0021536D65|nr:alkaline phosphatase family protein [Nocardioides sp. B-3]UUZ60087.1 alkaline phosphatase family protein [Nocardioides sp. B-3]